MDMNYFLKRLQAGEDMCDIGNEIAELMNEAHVFGSYILLLDCYG